MNWGRGAAWPRLGPARPPSWHVIYASQHGRTPSRDSRSPWPCWDTAWTGSRLRVLARRSPCQLAPMPFWDASPPALDRRLPPRNTKTRSGTAKRVPGRLVSQNGFWPFRNAGRPSRARLHPFRTALRSGTAETRARTPAEPSRNAKSRSGTPVVPERQPSATPLARQLGSSRSSTPNSKVTNPTHVLERALRSGIRPCAPPVVCRWLVSRLVHTGFFTSHIR